MTVRAAILGVLFLALAAAVAYSVIKPTSVFGVQEKGLTNSINRELASEAQGPSDLQCEQKHQGRWRCHGFQFDRSVRVRGFVKVDDQGCWRIVRAFKGQFKGRHGCISVFDAIGLL